MGYLKKEDVFFERDNEGNLLPLDIVLETLSDKPMIKVTPLTKGELQEIVSKTQSNSADADLDIDIIIKHCTEPKFTEDDRKSLKTLGKAVFTNAIALAIFSVSTGVSQEKLLEEGKNNVLKNELDELKKN